MSIDMNYVIFAGRLTDDPTTIGDGKGCRFDVASNRTYRDKEGNNKEDPTFMPVTAWGSLAELVTKRCSKGSQVIVTGRLEVRKIEREDGTSPKYVNIIANDVRFVDGRPSEAPRENTRGSDSTPFPANTGLPTNIDPKSAAALMKLLQEQSRGR